MAMFRRAFGSARTYLILLVVLYTGWIGYVWYRDKPIDFYLLYGPTAPTTPGSSTTHKP